MFLPAGFLWEGLLLRDQENLADDNQVGIFNVVDFYKGVYGRAEPFRKLAERVALNDGVLDVGDGIRAAADLRKFRIGQNVAVFFFHGFIPPIDFLVVMPGPVILCLPLLFLATPFVCLHYNQSSAKKV